MNKIKKKIIAIGGVGVSPESDKKLDNFILNHSKKTKNNIGFLGTASKDDEEKINNFYKRFKVTNAYYITIFILKCLIKKIIGQKRA